MAENTKIEWADHTFNPWIGCTKVGPGCDHCYAEALQARFNGVKWGAGQNRRLTSDSNWNQPRKWQRQAAAFDLEHKRRQRVFCASLADVFDNEVPESWRDDLFALIEDTPDLDWLLLTKRIGNVMPMMQRLGLHAFPQNVWLGATVVNQMEAERDVPKLIYASNALQANITFLSIEPMLGPITLDAINDDLGHSVLLNLDWIIAGGESGAGARPMHPTWVGDLRNECINFGVSFMFKQWGHFAPLTSGWPSDKVVRVALDGTISDDPCGGAAMIPLGVKHAGRSLWGKTYDGVPQT